MSKCLICQNEIAPFLSFGKMPIANGFLTAEQVPHEPYFDLAVGYCPHCHMVQLTELVEPSVMFNENYAYFASTSTYMCRHFKKFADWMMNSYLSEDPFVVEIGSNDGIMLQNFAAKKIRHLGVEPSENVAAVARKKGLNTICRFFDTETADSIVDEYGQADILVGANVMCHIPYIHSVFEGALRLLKPEGVLIFEDPYMGEIVRRTSYDQIYDEHAFYFTATSVSFLAKMHGLELIDVLPQVTHGGSMRYVLARIGTRPVSQAVTELSQREIAQGLHQLETYQKLAESIAQNKDDLMSLLQKLKAQGARVVGYGATSKSTTVTNYCGITPELVQFITDTTPIKQNKLSPGAHIPIKDYTAFTQQYPDYALLFAWNHADEIMEKERAFREQGGKFILYVDRVRIE